ncbi:hypothetical protein EVAR_97582_1 [Eumeta japonica]|uniref:Uncharacterized protein n=1 Tax=Eumeta variegata TaxID=151549 RepID=A0A4C1WS80_EUMVA|nr:hypothetical protein EVAR_97582_1 [Eumeta japonica]
MISGCHMPSPNSGPFLVEELHRSRKPVSLTSLLVHGHSVDDNRVPHGTSDDDLHASAVLKTKRLHIDTSTPLVHYGSGPVNDLYH